MLFVLPTFILTMFCELGEIANIIQLHESEYPSNQGNSCFTSISISYIKLCTEMPFALGDSGITTLKLG